MKRNTIAAALAGALCLAGCASMSDSGWTTLVDGAKGLENFDRVGNSNWRAEDGLLVADRNPGKDPSYLVTRTQYKDFMIRAEFYVEANTNSGIFIRCQNPQKLDSKSCYEVNVWDKRPDPTYGTGAIVGVAAVKPMPTAGGKWNTYEITAKGAHLTVVLNGQKTADVDSNQLLGAGFVGLQHGEGLLKWRKVEIKPL